LDAQAVGNALFGLQRMKSNSPEVRALVQAMAKKLQEEKVILDSEGIGSALYGLHRMSSDVPQVRALLSALTGCIEISEVYLSGQGIADSLYGLAGMTTDCKELRTLLTVLASKIDETTGKLDSQEIGNALYGLQGLSSQMVGARLIAGKLGEKLKRSKAVLLSQHIGMAMLGLQRLGPETVEVRFLMRQLAKRISESERTRLSSAAIADAVFGLQGMTADIPEVQELATELAKKVSASDAGLTPPQIARALFGLQSFQSSASFIEESALGLDSDEVQFLISTLWDKIKVVKEPMELEDIAISLQGISGLRMPIGENIRQYLYSQVVKNQDLADVELDLELEDEVDDRQPVTSEYQSSLITPALINTVRGLMLNNLAVPKWLAFEYNAIESRHESMPVLPQSRADKIVAQRYILLNPNPKTRLATNIIVNGFRLDLSFPEIKLNVELDGPSHRDPARARFDRARDRFMAAKGYEVLRLPLTGRSVDDLVNQIRDTVSDKMESILDKEIQQIYAPDAAYLYTPETARKVYNPRGKNL